MAGDENLVSCFIDLVGIRDLARESTPEYHDALVKFQEHVADLCTSLEGEKSGIYLFSDSIFAQAEGFGNLANFIRSLRHRLLDEGLYFKGSIRPGGLGATPAYELPLVDDKVKELARSKKLFGHYFGENAAYLFALQEQLKGIGIFIDKRREYDVDLEGTAYSCYLPQLGSIKPEPYLDLLLEQEDMDDAILERILHRFFKAKSRSKKTGRFYISLLVLWIQSTKLDGFKYDPFGEGGLISILLSGRFERLFGDVGGIEIVYLCLLNRIYREREKIPRDLFYDTKKYVLSRRRLSRSLDNVPSEILAATVRNEFLEDLSRELIRKSPGEREALLIITELVSQEKRNTEIADELNYRHVRTSSGRPWTERMVRELRGKSKR